MEEVGLKTEPTVPVYHSKLRAKREERLQQQQLQLQQHRQPLTDNVERMETNATTSTRSASVSILTARTTARSISTDEARRRLRAEARRQLIEFPGTVWDVVRTNDMAMLRNFFLVEGAAKLVHAHSKSVDEFGRTLLHTAVWWGRIDAAQFLIQNGATLNEFDTVSTRLTPLMDAARTGHTEIGILLLEHGADVTLRDASGDNAFHWAARHSRGTFLLRLSLKLESIDHGTLVECWTARNVRCRTPADYIRTHTTIFPMVSKRLGNLVPLHRMPPGSSHRHHHSFSGPPGDHSPHEVDRSPLFPIPQADSSRPPTATTETPPLSGIDDLGLDVGSFAYKPRDSMTSH